MKERLELVRDFGELRVGMIVVVTDCTDCDGAHRGILTGFEPNSAFYDPDGGDDVIADSFTVLPNPPCVPPEDSFGVSAGHVAERRLFRVDDGLEASSSTSHSRGSPRRERVR